MRFPTIWLLCLSAVWLPVSSRPCAAAPSEELSVRNAWAHFGIGSWKLVRVYTETLKENGDVESVSTTETKTTLIRADNKSYTLRIDVTVEVAGKRLTAEPRFVTYGTNGELQGQTVTVKQLGTEKVEINGTPYTTNVEQIVISGAATTSVSTVHYSGQVPAHVLKRRTKVTDNETMAHNYEALVEVVAIRMPEKVLTEFKPASHVKTIESRADGTRKITLEVHCEEVPGGIVAHTSRQLDRKGQVLLRSTLELVDYGVEPLRTKSRQPLLRRRFLKGRRRGQR